MDLRNLFKSSDNVQAFSAGAIIFAEGMPGDVMYVVLEGEVEVSIEGELFEVVKPGEMVGEMALLDARGRSATAVAKTDCRLASIDQKQFLSMVQQTPLFSLDVMRALADRLRRTSVRGGT